jgi:hypothetical protein
MQSQPSCGPASDESLLPPKSHLSMGGSLFDIFPCGLTIFTKQRRSVGYYMSYI